MLLAKCSGHLEIVLLVVMWGGYLFVSLRRKQPWKGAVTLYPSLQPLADYDMKVLGTKTKRANPVLALVLLSYFLLTMSRRLADLGPSLFSSMRFGMGLVVPVIVVVALLSGDRKVDRVAAQQRNAESPAAPQ